MQTSLTSKELHNYLSSQIKHFIPDNIFVDGMIRDEDIQISLDKCDNCFKHINNSLYSRIVGGGEIESIFSHLHADQYAQFLVYLANYIWNTRHDKIICDRIMYLNRILHSFMMSYKAKIPDIMLFGHPVGAVIGNADYSNYLYISQNCTINTGSLAEDGSYTPKIGNYFFIGAGAVLIGNEPIGDNCSIGANAMLYNTALEDNSIVINNNGKIEIRKKIGISAAARCFR